MTDRARVRIVDPLRVRVTGPLAPFKAGFAEELRRLGYTPRSAETHLRLAAHLSRWLTAQGLDAHELSPAAVQSVLGRSPRRRLHTPHLGQEPGAAARLPAGAGCRAGTPACPAADGPAGGAALALPALPHPPSEASKRRPLGTTRARSARSWASGSHPRGVEPRGARRRQRLRARLRPSADPGHGQAHSGGAALAAWLPAPRRPDRATAERGRPEDRELARGRACRRALSPPSCKRSLPPATADRRDGRRDFAILTCCWRGSGCERARSPASRLRTSTGGPGRSSCAARAAARSGCRCPPTSARRSPPTCAMAARRARRAARSFVLAAAPHRALTAARRRQVVASAARRAGLGQLYAHRLRHTAATEALRGGASLPEVGQLLRHRQIADDRDLRQGRPRGAATNRPPLAGRRPMSPLRVGARRLPDRAPRPRLQAGARPSGCSASSSPISKSAARRRSRPSMPWPGRRCRAGPASWHCHAALGRARLRRLPARRSTRPARCRRWSCCAPGAPRATPYIYSEERDSPP